VGSGNESGKQLRGATASNAGDDFHILWALSHSLKLLDASSDLTAVTVEGIPALALANESAADWDGVDVALFYGGESLETAYRVVIEQLKYSTASPEQSWTVARLCYASNKAKDNSVIARLAKAFSAVRRRACGLKQDGLVVKLVTNQPLAKEVTTALTGKIPTTTAQQAHLKQLRAASGLGIEEFEILARSLDFSDCCGPTRFAVHQRIISAIAEIASSEAWAMMLELRHLIYSRMLPEGSEAPITRGTVLAALHVNDMDALLPCPARLETPQQLVSRHLVREIAKTHIVNHKRICLHGEGGCGKTTALLELQTRLPAGSELVVFDCYGGGSYLDSDGQRHLPGHAMLHLCNELAARVGAPMLVLGASGADYPRQLMSRLRKAADIVRLRDPGAQLILAIDAADNSITAAATKTPPERSFVRDIVTFGEFPENVRLIITCRTGRLPELQLPADFLLLALGEFGESETAEFVNMRRPETPLSSAWIADLHRLSGGNARVIGYALKYGEENSKDPLDYLNPHGKDLPRIFGDRVTDALRRGGDMMLFGRLCGALIALPRPIPSGILAQVAGLTEAELKDAANDLTPGLLYIDDQVGFSDEDFEAFIRTHAAGSLADTYRRAADLFLRNHTTDSYSAEHAATMLWLARDTFGLIRFVQDHPEPIAIKDPVRRREVHLQRLKLAMQVARAHGGTVEAVNVLLRGARALKTDAAMRKMLTDNIDLSSAFSASSLRRTVLMEPKLVGLQGRALSWLALQAARSGNVVEARDWLRQFRSWLAILHQHRAGKNAPQWKLGPQELAAEGEAALLAFGAEAGAEWLRRWTPKSVMPPVLLTIVQRLLTGGEVALVQSLLPLRRRVSAWSVFVQVPLAFTEGPVDVTSLNRVLGHWTRRRWITSEEGWKKLSSFSREDHVYRILLVAAEIVASRCGITDAARSVLTLYVSDSWRRPDKLYTGQHRIIDASLRAYTLLEVSNGRIPAAESFVLPLEAPLAEEHTKEQRAELKRSEERRTRLVRYVNKLLPLHIARAELLLASSEARKDAFERFEKLVQSNIKSYDQQDSYELQEMRQYLAQTVAELLPVPGLDVERIARLTLSFSRGGFSREMQDAVKCLAMNRGTHDVILVKVLESAKAKQLAREPATDVATELLEMARMISLISQDEAAAIFSNASEALNEVDYDSIHQLGMLNSFARRAARAMSRDQRRESAAQFVIVASDTWSYLKDLDRFPWNAAVRGVTCLDPCIGLAALAQWDDAGDVAIGHVVSDFLQEAALTHALSVADALVLLWLSGEFDTNILDLLVQEKSGSAFKAGDLQELVRLALSKVDGEDGIPELRYALELHDGVAPCEAAKEARSLLNFYDHEVRGFATEIVSTEPPDTHADNMPGDAPASFAKRFVTAREIEDSYRDWREQQARTKEYASTSEFLDFMKRTVSRSDRKAHLEALASAQLGDRYPQADALMAAALAWLSESPAVAAWCQLELPGLLRQRLRFFNRYRYEEGLLGQLLDASNLRNSDICDALLDGIENGASEWDSGTVYGLLELLANYLEPADAATVLVTQLEAETQRVHHAVADWPWREVPEDIEEALGQMIYAFLGDVELARRWTAAHAFRAAARLGLSGTLRGALERWENTTMDPFRAAGQPVYWRASRVWLSIALARITHETPPALKPYAETIFRFATDQSFPHVLCREFLVDALRDLHVAGTLPLQQLREAENINRPALPARSKRQVQKSTTRFAPQENRRFHFDSTDTLPYWYEPALRIFADVEMPEFLDVAERWIVDIWHADPNIWMWDHEPRKQRLGDGSTMHRHGSLPSAERYSTHLEWHAMFCAVGELMASRPLGKVRAGEYGSLSYFLSGDRLTWPPVWLADLRRTKPLQKPLWCNDERDDSVWLGQVDLPYVLYESGILAVSDEVIVASRVSGRHGERRWSTDISTALVTGSTAAALLRSLQGVRRWDYRIPDEGDELEHGIGDFKLKGWLRDVGGDPGIDKGDIGSRHVSRVAVVPGKDVLRRLSLRLAGESQQQWLGTEGELVMHYRAWSDDLDHQGHTDDLFRVEGYRLVIARSWLRKYLLERGMDLILEISGDRRTKEQKYDEDISEPTTRFEYDHLIVFRRDGTIESADGPVGTW
jgi:hypothetical protein